MPDYIDSEGVRVSPAAMQRAADLERFHGLLQAWRDDKIDDGKWAELRSGEKAFDRWLWRMGVP